MNERKLIDEIKLAVQEECITGYWNGNVFIGDDGITYTNIISTSTQPSKAFIVPYNNSWLVVVESGNSVISKQIINQKRKRDRKIIEPVYPVKTIFQWYLPPDYYSVQLFEGGDTNAKQIKDIFVIDGFDLNNRITKSKKNKYSSSMYDFNSNSTFYFYKEGNQLEINNFNYDNRGLGSFNYLLGDGIWCSFPDYTESLPNVTLNLTPVGSTPSESDDFKGYDKSYSGTFTTFHQIEVLNKGILSTIPISTSLAVDFFKPAGIDTTGTATYEGMKSFSHLLANLELTWSGSYLRGVDNDPPIVGIILYSQLQGEVSGDGKVLFMNNHYFHQTFTGEFSSSYKFNYNNEPDEQIATLNLSGSISLINDKNVSKPINVDKFFAATVFLNEIIDETVESLTVTCGASTQTATDSSFLTSNVTKAVFDVEYKPYYLNENVIYLHTQSVETELGTATENFIVRGVITDMIYTTATNILQIDIQVNSITKTKVRPFIRNFILDNGSFYNWFYSQWVSTAGSTIPYVCDKSAYFPILNPMLQGYSSRDVNDDYEVYTGKNNIFTSPSFINNINLIANSKLGYVGYIPLFAFVEFPKDTAINESYKTDGAIPGYPEYYLSTEYNIADNSQIKINDNTTPGTQETIVQHLRFTNIVNNKIYVVCGFDGSGFNTFSGGTNFKKANKAYIAQWDIKENGDIKFNKIFEVPYKSLKAPEDNGVVSGTGSMCHSYYP